MRWRAGTSPCRRPRRRGTTSILFSSWHFLIFFPVVFLLHWSIRGFRARKVLLLAASYYFYAGWDPRFLALIIASSACDYLVGLGLDADPPARRKKLLLIVSLVFNLGILGFFKYYNFFVDQAVAALNAVGFGAHHSTLQIVLPVGISFYTFQTLSYTIDVYRGQMKPTRNALDFFLFVAFFPQLVAGPIVRAKTFLPQLTRPVRLRAAPFFDGLEQFMVGLFKKLIIADPMGGLVDATHANLGAYSSQEILYTVIAFSLQIYADFSGYSDMAIGTARMIGYELPVNFRLPFLSLSVTEHWRRWHITMSSWFRDYVYIPLGGNRLGTFKTYRNLVIVFLTTGLWHGASWSFITFGAWNGVILIIERLWREYKKARNLTAPTWARPLLIPLSWLAFMTATQISLLWVRCDPSLSRAVEILGIIIRWDRPGHDDLFLYWQFYILTAISIAYHILAALRVRQRLTARGNVVFLRCFFYTVYLLMMLSFAPLGERPFIYFQF